MVREIETIERRVGLTPISVPTTSGSQQLINALQNFSGVVGGIAETAATERAAIDGMLAREQGKEVSLRPGITRPTAAFNQAYRDTDARLLARGAEDLIQQSLNKALDPRNLNSSSAGLFDSQLEGIIQGTLSQALPENRGRLEEQLKRVGSQGKNRVQTAVMNYENKQLENQFKLSYSQLREQRTAALLNKDDERVQQLDVELAKFFQDWGTLSENVNQQIPGLVQQLSQEETKAKWLGDFLQAQEQGVGSEYLNTFTQTKTPGLNPQDKMELISEMVRINNATRSAQAGSQALSVQMIENDIDDPFSERHINNEEQLEQHPEYYNLTPLQQQQVSHKLMQKNAADLRQSQKLASTLTNIANGRAAFVDKSTINDLFLSQLEAIEQQTGQRADIDTQFAIVQQLQTNVPKFDALISSMLTNGDPASASKASALYATASLGPQKNLINLSGDAASIAEKMKTQYNLTANPTEETVKGVLKQVLDKTDPQINERLTAATQTLNKNGPKLFKDLMGVKPDPFTDQGAYAVFKDAFTSAMVRGNTPEEAARIAKQSMSNWGTDNWFIKDQVNIAPPTKMLPMSEGNYNIRNQILLRFDDIAKANNAARDPASGQLPMGFANNYQLPLDKISQQDFIYKPLDLSKAKGRVPLPPAAIATGIALQPILGRNTIRVEVNGVKGDLRLVSSPATLATPDSGLTYGLFAPDKFGVYQQLTDPNSPDGLAYITLNDVNVVAPEVAREGANEQLIKTMTNARRLQREKELEQTFRQQNELLPRLRAKTQAFTESRKNKPMTPEDIEALLKQQRSQQEKPNE